VLKSTLKLSVRRDPTKVATCQLDQEARQATNIVDGATDGQSIWTAEACVLAMK
jgi:hypothetical protein